MMWFVYSLTFALTSSVTVVIAKKIMGKMDEYLYLTLSNIFTFPFLLAIVLIFYGIPRIDITFAFSIIGSIALGTIATILAYRAIKHSELSLVGPISAFNPAFTAIVSFVILGEEIDARGFLGIVLIVLGAYLMEVFRARLGLFKPFKSLITHKGVQLSFVAYFLWSITPTFEKTAIFHTYPQNPPFIGLVGMFFATVVYGTIAVFKHKRTVGRIEITSNLKLFLLGGLLGGIGMAAAFSSFSLTNLGYATAVFKLSSLFAVISGWLFFGEKNIKERLLGSIVMLIGVLLLVL